MSCPGSAGTSYGTQTDRRAGKTAMQTRLALNSASSKACAIQPGHIKIEARCDWKPLNPVLCGKERQEDPCGAEHTGLLPSNCGWSLDRRLTRATSTEVLAVPLVLA